MDGPNRKAKRHQHLRRTRSAVLYQTLCRPLSKRIAGEQCRVPTFVWRLPRISAYYANLRDCTLPGERDVHREAQRQGPTAGPANNPDPNPLRVRYRRQTPAILRFKCVSPCNFDSHELGGLASKIWAPIDKGLRPARTNQNQAGGLTGLPTPVK